MNTCATCGKQSGAGEAVCAACGSALGAAPLATGAAVPFSPSLPPGTKLQNGAFTVGKVVGQGGFGITYKGGDMRLRRYVAIKEFFPFGAQRVGQTVQPTGGMATADYQKVKAKFIEEAGTLARFEHPNIVRVFSAFEENNTAYMVMEFLEGKTVQQHLDTKGALGEAEVIGYAEKIGEALKTVHRANIIHRDIKPDNILVTNDGRVVLIDFGTARAFAAGKTIQQTAMLTHGYAPLEQYGQSARFGVYSDIYALGATLYHCLTGQLPPQATDRATGVELQPPVTLNPYITYEVSNAIMWALQLRADQRPQSVQAFIDALKGAARPHTQTPAHQTQQAFPATLPTPPGYPPPHTPQYPPAQWPQQAPAPPLPHPSGHTSYPLHQEPAMQSGLGENSSPLPDELKGTNWGAFLLCVFWGFSHNLAWVSLLCFVPCAGGIMPFVAAAKGNEWAWKNRKWQSVQEFKDTQKAWQTAGLIWPAVIFVLVSIGIPVAFVY